MQEGKNIHNNPDKVLIERGVTYIQYRPLRLPLYNMEVGDSFFLTNEQIFNMYGHVTAAAHTNLRNIAWYYSKKSKKVFSTRAFATGMRIWRLDDDWKFNKGRKKKREENEETI